MTLKFYIKKEEDSLYFEHFFKVVYNKARKIGGLWIKLRKLKILFYSICPVGGIGCSVAYWFLRKNNMADAKKLADYVEEYLIIPTEESEE